MKRATAGAPWRCYLQPFNRNARPCHYMLPPLLLLLLPLLLFRIAIA